MKTLLSCALVCVREDSVLSSLASFPSCAVHESLSSTTTQSVRIAQTITTSGSTPPLTIKGQCLSLLSTVCSSMRQLLQVHARILTSGNADDTFLTSELLRFCAVSSPRGSLSHAQNILSHASNPIPSSWNHVIRGCASRGVPNDAIRLFLRMRDSGTRPGNLTFPFVLKACASLSDLGLGRQVHAEITKTGNDSDVFVQNGLVSLYGSCRKVVDARKVFDAMPIRTVASWNAILTAYVDNSWVEESMDLFSTMMCCSGLEPDETTMVVLLSASAELGNLSLGRLIHLKMMEKGLFLNLQLGTALVNMYSKCGLIGDAYLVFVRMSEKNVWTWTAMILGFAQHGFTGQALDLFSMMKKSHVKPNYVTYLGVLCACSHAGMVEDGYQFFHEMTTVHGIQPRMPHYSAMVDVLGRKGLLEDAYQFIQSMTVVPDPVVWRTLLSSCNVHKSYDKCGIGDRVRLKLLELEPRRCGNYIMVANMCAEVGSWEEAARLRKLMRVEGLKKVAGKSCIEVGGSTHRFLSGFCSQVSHECIYDLLELLNQSIKGFVVIDEDPVDHAWHIPQTLKT